MAEEVGFEPTELAFNGFQDRRLKPLGHSSVILNNITEKLWDCNENYREMQDKPIVFDGFPMLCQLFFDLLQTTHIRNQHFRNQHGAIFLLIIFQHRQQSSPNSQT